MSTREESYSGYPLWIVPLTGASAPEPDPHPNAVRIYADENQDLRTIKSDGTDAPIGGGGAAPTAFEIITGNNVSVENGLAAFLTWDTSTGPQTLLDISTPEHPTVLASGIYAVSVWVAADDAITAGGTAYAELKLDPGPMVATTRLLQTFAPATADPYPNVLLAATRYLLVGAEIQVKVNNEDGVSAINFNIAQATVQQVS